MHHLISREVLYITHNRQKKTPTRGLKMVFLCFIINTYSIKQTPKPICHGVVQQNVSYFFVGEKPLDDECDDVDNTFED